MGAKLSELVRAGDLAGFEARCLELLESGELPLAELADCFEQLEQAGQGAAVLPLAQLVFENIDVAAQPTDALKLACAVLGASPDNEELRGLVVDLYRRVHGSTPGFDAILASSGLATGRSVRAALRVLDFCLALHVGDTLISRMDGRVFEVAEVDRERGLFTLRRGDRATTLAAREVVNEYERISPDDFRVLRQLRPDRLAELIDADPVALVIGLMRAHGDRIDADELKQELVPRHIEAKDWPKWWSRARTLIKRCPHIVVEGRSPVVLTYSAEAVSLEEQTWDTLAEEQDPAKWLSAVQGYLREIKQRGRSPDPAFLTRAQQAILQRARAAAARRPADALAWVLALEELVEQGTPPAQDAETIARELLSQSDNPGELIVGLTEDCLWRRALTELRAARPGDWAEHAGRLVGRAPAAQLDTLVELLRAAGRLDRIQQHIDDAVADPTDYPELVYWLWKGPAAASGLRLPSDDLLLARILETLAALGTSLTLAPELTRTFRTRMKSALALRDYAKAVACLARSSPESAVTFRGQLERLEGLGPNARTRLLEALRQAHPQLWAQRAAARAPWEDPDVIWATPAGIQRKTAERDELVHVKMPENARRIGEAAAHGDLSENSEYRFALEERDLLRARLAQMNHDLSIARPLTPQDVRTDQVGIGTRVKLRPVPDGPVRVVVILGPFETDVEEGVYNYRAPICRQLLGRRVGERVRLPDGEQDLEIVAIENALQARA